MVLEGVELLGTHGMARGGRSLGAGLKFKRDSGSSRFFSAFYQINKPPQQAPTTMNQAVLTTMLSRRGVLRL